MFRSVVLAAVLLVGLTACSSSGRDSGGVGGGAGAGENTTNGTFTVYRSGANAVTYDELLVPVGATAGVTVEETGGGTTVTLVVTGLQKTRAYGAHLHVKPCGAAPADSGAHLQHSHDPAASVSPPSVDPSYANPGNEVWLDFTTDAAGAARSTGSEDWIFDPKPRSLVIHAQPTKTGPGEAGTAGARAACLSLPE
jgi:Cu-Zn family superoxide dismutase